MTIPIVESLAMPVGFLGVLAIPFGLDGYFWHLMGRAVDLMLLLSQFVASTPFATHALPAISVTSLLFFTLGLLWLTLWSTRLRLFGSLPIMIGVILALNGQRPDIVIARDGLALAARGPDGRLVVMGKGASSFVVTQWLSADGDMRSPLDPKLKRGPLCNATGCLVQLVDGHRLALTLRARDLEEDCKAVAVLVTPLEAPKECKAVTVDHNLTAALGSVEVLADGEGGYLIHGARRPTYDRPWSPKPKAAVLEPVNPIIEPEDPALEPISPR